MKFARRLIAYTAMALALGAAIAAGASAAPPELGRCESVPPGTGEYEHASCTGGAKAAGGNFDWRPGALKNKFVSASGPATFQTTSGSKIACKSILEQGEYTSPQEELDKVRLLGCSIVALGGKCQNAAPEEVVTPSLEGDLGFIKGGTQPVVGVDLGPGRESPAIVEFNCDTPAAFVHVTVLGSVIAKVTPIDAMTSKFPRTYTALKGKQKPAKLVGEAKDTLTLLIGANPPAEAGLTAKLTTSNEEKLEIKALP